MFLLFSQLYTLILLQCFVILGKLFCLFFALFRNTTYMQITQYLKEFSEHYTKKFCSERYRPVMCETQMVCLVYLNISCFLCLMDLAFLSALLTKLNLLK